MAYTGTTLHCTAVASLKSCGFKTFEGRKEVLSAVRWPVYVQVSRVGEPHRVLGKPGVRHRHGDRE